MNRYRRIEITAFRRRVIIVSGGAAAGPAEANITVNDADSKDPIDIAFGEGRAILLEAMLLLKGQISDQTNDEAGVGR